MKYKTFNWLLIVFVLLFFTTLIVDSRMKFNAKDNACKELGFEEHQASIGLDYCIDKEDNLFFVKIECDSGRWLWQKMRCNAKKISVN